jgi:hypothetical protein
LKGALPSGRTTAPAATSEWAIRGLGSPVCGMVNHEADRWTTSRALRALAPTTYNLRGFLVFVNAPTAALSSRHAVSRYPCWRKTIFHNFPVETKCAPSNGSSGLVQSQNLAVVRDGWRRAGRACEPKGPGLGPAGVVLATVIAVMRCCYLLSHHPKGPSRM